MTRFGEILPIRQNLDGLFSIWQTFVPTLAFFATGQIFIVVNGQRLNSNLAIWSHWSHSILQMLPLWQILVSSVCLPFAIGVTLIPESPKFLIERNRTSDAVNAFRFFDLSDVETIKTEKAATRFTEALRSSENLKPLLTGFVMMAFFQVNPF